VIGFLLSFWTPEARASIVLPTGAGTLL
jgi:hypothetical protein